MEINNPAFYFITLGCPKNVVDTENMEAVLESAGIRAADSPETADVILVNTCSFIESAKQESINTIFEASALCEETGAFLVVTGCLPQRYKDEIADAIADAGAKVDAWMGLADLEEIKQVVLSSLEKQAVRKYYKPSPDRFQDLPRRFSTPGNYGYLKIAEGCSHSCAFCIIPEIRGRYRSLPIEAAEKRALEIVGSGRKEVILIAQDTTLYGLDVYGEKKLAELLRRLAKTPGLEWLRLMYAYPTSLDEEVLKVIGEEEKICNYVDIPLQHSHPDVLKKMARPHSPLQVQGVIDGIRKHVPDAAIRTAFIVGHPGETEKRFMHLVDFVRENEFYNVGVFTYSQEQGTASADYKTRSSNAEALRRKEYLLSVQQEVSRKAREKMKGKVLRAVCEQTFDVDFGGEAVIIDFEGDDTSGSSVIPKGVHALGRTEYDAPEIDGLLYITGEPPKEGSFFNVEVTGSEAYDLIGKPI